mgnify:CR=1 FL=1
MSKTNITVQLTKNENIVKFVTNSFITQSKSYEFNNIDEAEDSPIAQHLFHLPFVKTVYISQNFIAIEKFPFNLTQVKWQDVQDEVAESISDYFKSGQPVINTISESPIFFSSTLVEAPKSSIDRSSILVTIFPPVAFDNASISLFLALLIAKIPDLAIWCCAKSSIPFWQIMTLAPTEDILSTNDFR